MTNDIAIDVKGLGKRYLLGASAPAHDSLRDLITDAARSLLRRRPSKQPEFWALKDATFQVRKGENVGIIGLNGAGKSTLLKILSRITEPTRGQARIVGRVGALLEVGTGFHPELTGRENVYLYGAILGMSQQEIAQKMDAIIDFAGIAQFIDTPVKRYSSGMYVRIAFAVAAHLEPEILLLDEVLAVGDLAFQRKCIEHAKSLQRRNATILFVSHNMFSIKTMCQRVIYLRKGEVVFDGGVDAGLEIYERDSQLTNLAWVGRKPDDWPLRITSCELLDGKGHPKTVFDFGEPLRIRLHYETREPIDEPNFIVALLRSDGLACCNFSNESDGISAGTISGTGVVELTCPPLKLIAETYSVSIIVREKGFQQILCGQVGGTFHVRHDLFDMHFGVFHESARWSIEADRRGTVAVIPESTRARSVP
jgi:lipopolysaccharide transport system ATP-binding protein